STAPQRSFLICASATTKGGTIKAMNYTPGDLALTKLWRNGKQKGRADEHFLFCDMRVGW
ncbi:hypothetical protein, partial [uncultured Mitsuokella sp.]